LKTLALSPSRAVLCISEPENACGEVNGNVRGWEGGSPAIVTSAVRDCRFVNWKALPSQPRS